MAGITGKNSLSVKKLDVQESKIPAIGFNKIRFAHKAVAGDTSFILSALTTPTEMTANGFVQPNLSVLSQLSLAQFRENFTLRSSLRGPLMEYLSYTIAGAQKVNLTFSAEDGEIFEGIFDYVPRTGNTLVDAAPLVVTGTLSAGSTDFNVGTPFEVGLYSSQQVGAVMVFIDNQIAYRNTSNNPPGVGVEGDYYEVHAGGGLGTIIRFNTTDVNDRGIIVVSVGALTERPNGSQLALIEALSGKVDNMIPTLAALAGVSVSSFGSYPSNVDLKAFGDQVQSNTSSITSLQSTKQDKVETIYLKDVKANNTDGGTFTSGSYQTRVLNTLENPGSVSWVSLLSNQFTLQPGTYELESSAPGYQVGNHKTRIRNITDGTTSIVGSAEIVGAGAGNIQTRSVAVGTLVISSAKVFELQHYAGSTQATNGFGSRVGDAAGESEVYAVVKITRVRS